MEPIAQPLSSPLAGYLAGSQGSLYPSDFAGLRFWGDASRTSVGAVATWTDQSGNGNDATQGTASARPTNTNNQINGLPALVFDGGDTLTLNSALNSLGAGSFTIFTVAKRASEDASQDAIISFGENGVSTLTTLYYSATSGRLIFRSNNTATNILSNGNTNTDFQVIAVRRSLTTQAISVNNGAENSNTSAQDTVGVNIGVIGAFSGGGSFLTGSIAEVLIYNRSLSASERTIVAQYLSSKYGITLA